MTGPRDRYQQATKGERASVLRQLAAKQWLQRWTARDVIQRALVAPDRNIPGTLANTILELTAAAE
jgi:hypothetical protein